MSCTSVIVSGVKNEQSRMTTQADVRIVALRWLARREYAVREMQVRLRKKGFPDELITAQTEDLVRENLLSDERFAESLVRLRYQRGQGPLRIIAELRDRGIADSLIECHISVSDEQWLESAYAVAARRFGESAPQSRRDWQKQTRFLMSRGFTHSQVRTVVGAVVYDTHEDDADAISPDFD